MPAATDNYDSTLSYVTAQQNLAQAASPPNGPDAPRDTLEWIERSNPRIGSARAQSEWLTQEADQMFRTMSSTPVSSRNFDREVQTIRERFRQQFGRREDHDSEETFRNFGQQYRQMAPRIGAAHRLAETVRALESEGARSEPPAWLRFAGNLVSAPFGRQVAQAVNNVIPNSEQTRVGYPLLNEVMPSVPFGGNVYAAGWNTVTREAMERIGAGRGTDQDYAVAARSIIDRRMQGERPFMGDVFDVVRRIPAFSGEFLIGGSLGRAAGSLLGGASRVGQVAPHAIQAASVIAPSAIESASRQAMPVMRGVDQQTGQVTPEQFGVESRGDLVSNLPAGLLDASIEYVSELSGGAIMSGLGSLGRGAGSLLGRIPGAGALSSGIASRWISSRPGRTMAQFTSILSQDGGSRTIGREVANSMGFHGVVGEMMEERLGDVLRGVSMDVFGLQGEPWGYGTTGDLVSGDRDRFLTGLRQLAVEGSAFMLWGAVTSAAGSGQRADAIDRMNPQQRAIFEATDGLEGVARSDMMRSLESVHDVLNEALKEDPGLTRSEARKLFDNLDGPLQRYAHVVADSLLPEKRAPERNYPMVPYQQQAQQQYGPDAPAAGLAATEPVAQELLRSGRTAEDLGKIHSTVWQLGSEDAVRAHPWENAKVKEYAELVASRLFSGQSQDQAAQAQAIQAQAAQAQASTNTAAAAAPTAPATSASAQQLLLTDEARGNRPLLLTSEARGQSEPAATKPSAPAAGTRVDPQSVIERFRQKFGNVDASPAQQVDEYSREQDRIFEEFKKKANKPVPKASLPPTPTVIVPSVRSKLDGLLEKRRIMGLETTSVERIAQMEHDYGGPDAVLHYIHALETRMEAGAGGKVGENRLAKMAEKDAEKKAIEERKAGQFFDAEDVVGREDADTPIGRIERVELLLSNIGKTEKYINVVLSKFYSLMESKRRDDANAYAGMWLEKLEKTKSVAEEAANAEKEMRNVQESLSRQAGEALRDGLQAGETEGRSGEDRQETPGVPPGGAATGGRGQDAGAAAEQSALTQPGLAQQAVPAIPVMPPELQALPATFRDSLWNNESLSYETKIKYAKTVKSVLDTMPPKAQKKLVDAIGSKIFFFSSKKEVTDHFIAKYPESKVAQKKLKSGEVFTAVYARDGSVYLDGEGVNYLLRTIYAHEFAHSVDGPKNKISNSEDWAKAWGAEIENGKLSAYARTSSTEGFAEFMGMLWGTEANLDLVEKKYPLSSAFAKKQNLWPLSNAGRNKKANIAEAFRGKPIVTKEGDRFCPSRTEEEERKAAGLAPKKSAWEAALEEEGIPTTADTSPQFMIDVSEEMPHAGTLPVVPPQQQGPPAPAQAASDQPVNLYQIIQALTRIWKVPFDTGRLRKKLTAVARTAPEHVRLSVLAAGNAGIYLHEVAHVALDKRLQVLNGLSAASLTALGLLDYEPLRKDPREGFGEYIRQRSDGSLVQPIAELEQKMESIPGIPEKLARTTGLFDKFRAQSAVGKAGGFISPTGQKESPAGQTKNEWAKEKASELGNRFNDAVVDFLGPLVRMEEEAKKRGVKFGAGEMPSEVWMGMLSMGPGLAARMADEGVLALVNGHWEKVGPTVREILSLLEPSDLANYDGEVSKFEVYAVAVHLLQEKKRGREAAPPDQLHYYQQAIKELAKDTAFMKRAKASAKMLTSAYNATLDTLVSVGFLRQEVADKLKDERPTYIPTQRVKEQQGWKDWFSRKNEQLPSPIKVRRGSGEQIVSPLLSYFSRLEFVSFIAQKQIQDLAVHKLYESGGMGSFIAQEDRPNVKYEVSEYDMKVLLNSLGVSKQFASIILAHMSPSVSAKYFKPAPYPTDGSQPTKVIMVDGKPVWYRVQDKLLYDLLTGQQGYQGPILGMATPFFKAIAKMVTAGATKFKLMFQFKNVLLFRDPKAFANNTMDLKSVKDLLPYYGKMYWLAARRLLNPDAESTEFINEYLKLAGQTQREFPIGPASSESLYRKARGEKSKIREVANFGERLLQFAGAGELGPRALEAANQLKALGWTEQRIKEERAKNPNRDPLPLAHQFAMLNAGAESTGPWRRGGHLVHKIGTIAPFFSPSVIAITKAIRSANKYKPRTLFLLALGMGLKLLHWLYYKDKKWYRELEPHRRHQSWVVEVGDELWAIPAARDFDPLVLGAFEESLRANYARNPDFAGWVQSSLGGLIPIPHIEPLHTGFELATNRSTLTGAPIIPARDERLPSLDRATQYQIPYAVGQLTGGLIGRGAFQAGRSLASGDMAGVREGLTPSLRLNSAPNQSLDSFYSEMSRMESARLSAQRQGVVYRDEDRYQRMAWIRQHEQFANLAIRGGSTTVGDRVVRFGTPNAQDRNAVEEFRIQLARLALGGDGNERSPFLAMDSLPPALRAESERLVAAQADHLVPRVVRIERGETASEFQARQERQRLLDSRAMDLVLLTGLNQAQLQQIYIRNYQASHHNQYPRALPLLRQQGR